MKIHHRFTTASTNESAKGTLIFLHGLLGFASNWGKILPYFQKDYNILTFDQRGHGRSEHAPSGAYNPKDYADDLYELCNKLNIQNAHIIGHSMGGKVAMALVDIAPNVVKQLVVLDMAPVAYTTNRHDNVFNGLHAVINEPGSFDGFSANYSGHGFSDMRFTFHGFDEQGFDQWISKLKNTGEHLDRQTYFDLEIPSNAHPVTYYSSVREDLYHDILNLCVPEGMVCMNEQMRMDAKRANGKTHKESHGEH